MGSGIMIYFQIDRQFASHTTPFASSERATLESLDRDAINELLASPKYSLSLGSFTLAIAYCWLRLGSHLLNCALLSNRQVFKCLLRLDRVTDDCI